MLVSPVAVDGGGGDEEEADEEQHAGNDSHALPLLLLGLLELPPLEVVELATLPHVACYTASTETW